MPIRFINIYAPLVAAIFVLLASSLATTENKEIIEVKRIQLISFFLC